LAGSAQKLPATVPMTAATKLSSRDSRINSKHQATGWRGPGTSFWMLAGKL
jgi:hypothetical protein